MKRVPFILVLIVLFSFTVYAAEFLEVSSNRLTGGVEPGDSVDFELFLNNTSMKTESFTLSVAPMSSNIIDNVQFDPSLSPIEVRSKSTERIVVSLRLAEDIDPNTNYIVNFLIKDISGSIVEEHPLTVRVNPFDNLVEIRYISTHIVPNQDKKFILELTNKGNDFLEGVEVRIDGELFSVSEIVDLIPRRALDVSFDVSVDSSTKFGEYDSKVVVYNQQQIIGRSSKVLSVGEQFDLKESEIIDNGILSTKYIVTQVNDGNVDLDVHYEKSFGWFENLFVFSSPKYTSKEKIDGQYVYVWDVKLSPGEKVDINIKVEYKILLGLIILLLVAIYGIKAWYETGVLIKKRIMKGKNGIKVVLSIKNNLQDAVNNVQVIDKLPSILHPGDYDIIAPDEVRKTNHGTNIKWDISHLGKGEERIFSYKIKHKIHVVGKISLPAATVVYRHKGTEYRIRSNKLGLY